MDRPTALEILGLTENDDLTDVVSARRRLARRCHPDVGGDDDTMMLVNQAADFLLAESSSEFDDELRLHPEWDGVEIDRPSFVIDVLPVEAFEWILTAANVLGHVVDDEPPYALEVLIDSRPDRWCRLEIVPDAGSSTVSILTEGHDPTEMVPLFVTTINELSESSSLRDGERRPS